MRLIAARTLELHDFSLARIPPYAILSHTWNEGEVTFQDMSSPDRVSKQGYAKIVQTCRLALEYGLDFAWVDTCCIDKSSSAELTESINSMFAWYKQAVVCFVYLVDLPANTPDFGFCRWFTRGFTLQELLAPSALVFYDQNWSCVGPRVSFIDALSKITGIISPVLDGSKAITDCSVATRMSWAARRQTPRVEDKAYCLLGIFDVNMPLIYGEGKKAFRRLQEEIVRCYNDLTIFAWEPPGLDDNSVRPSLLSLFADSPLAFSHSSTIEAFTNDFPEFSLTNKGLVVSPDVPLRVFRTPYRDALDSFGLLLGYSFHQGGLFLRMLAPGVFCRWGNYPLAGFHKALKEEYYLSNSSSFHILVDPNPARLDRLSDFQTSALQIPVNDTYSIVQVVPEYLWNFTDRIVFRMKPYHDPYSSVVMGMQLQVHVAGTPFDFFVICDDRQYVPRFKVGTDTQHQKMIKTLFGQRHRNKSLLWHEFEELCPEVLLLHSFVDVDVNSQLHTVSVDAVQAEGDDTSAYSLRVKIRQVVN